MENLIEELRDAAEVIGIRVRRERLLREVGYHVRSGGHDLSHYDWMRYLDFAEAHFARGE